MIDAVSIPITKLKNNIGQIPGVPKNPRTIKDDKYQALIRSIRADPEMLELREVIAYPLGNELVVIAGNMRLTACKELNFKNIPCKILSSDTPEEKLRAYTMKDNLPYGEFDFDALRFEWDMAELSEWSVDFPNFGTSDLGLDAEPEKEMPVKHELDDSQTDNEKVYLSPLPCFMGAYYIRKANKIDIPKLQAWKKDPLGNSDYTDFILSDFLRMWGKRKTWIDFVSVPPPSMKRNGYENYPINIVAEQFAEKINIPYKQIFRQRDSKLRKGTRARMHQEQGVFEFSEIPEGNVGLILDDVVTTRITFMIIKEAFMTVKKTPLCVAWCNFEHAYS